MTDKPKELGAPVPCDPRATDTPRRVLEQLEAGSLSVEAALEALRGAWSENLGHTRIDHDRQDRVGAAEVIFGASKTADQMVEIAERMISAGSNVLITRVRSDIFPELANRLDGFSTYEPTGLLSRIQVAPTPVTTPIPVVCAGTSDVPIAEEARQTVEFYGHATTPLYDCGVAGLHRLLEHLPVLRAARVVIVCAGMEGALPSVVGGQVAAPVIAVPTSVGYGANLGGIAALLTMLNSCASGVLTVNIDNGFGAGYAAAQINRLGEVATASTPEA